MKKKINLLLFFLVFCLASLALGAQSQKRSTEWYREGQVALRQHDYYLAIDSFIESLEQNPSYVDSYKGLVEAYMALGQSEKAFFYAQKALPLAQNDFAFYVQYGDLLRERRDFVTAQMYFERVLKWQENHVGALLGMARLYRAQDNLILAERYYNFLFELYPNYSQLPAGEVVTLLQAQGKEREAISFIHKIENYYQTSPDFAELVSQFYLSIGNYPEASRYGKHFLVLAQKLRFSDSEIRAYELLGKIALLEGKNQEAIQILRQAFPLKRDDVILNYLLGVAYLGQRDIPQAQDFFFRALEGSKWEEVYQEALEATLFLPETSLNNPYRQKLAKGYSDRARELSRIYLYEQALSYAEQAKEIDPQDDEVRLLVAKLYRDLGYPVLSLRELAFLKNERKYVSDELDTLLENSQLAFVKSPLYTWGFTDVPSLNRLIEERNKSRIALFYMKQPVLHGSNDFLLSSLERSLNRISFVTVQNQSLIDGVRIPYFVNRISEAFRLVREHNLDYYIILTPSETFTKGFSIKAEIFLGKTGTKVKEIIVARFNEKSRATALEQLSREVRDFMSVKGSFIRREGEKALINVGRQDKITNETEFAIVRDSDLSLSEETGIYTYDTAKVVGFARVEKLDDFVSEVSLRKQGLVDVIDVNHWLIPLPVNLP